ncbi:MAG: DegQ family serine endoprotease [Methylobacterium mesophilicum]|nr:DegQ family serine endoprotease [Methylobacterium mesophilicum]
MHRTKTLSALLLASALVAPQAMAQDAKPLTDMQKGQTEAPAPSKRQPFSRQQIQLSFAPLVAQTAPAVVNVYATQKPKSRSPFMDDPLFQEFFGRQMTPRASNSLGSGVLVDPAGWIVTNYHVIKDADEIKVATSDGREFASKLMLQDESLDLAVLKIEGDQPFPAIKLGDSEALEVGDLVLAIGNPFGVGQTTTSGIVSALARTHVGVGDFGFFIQTDAAINPGNSGGALIDMDGALVGINTAIYSRSGGSIGIGFAIPSNIVRAVASAAMKGQDYFERPFVGATFEPVTAQVAEALGMDRPYGALVVDVTADGPAAKAGIQAGDVILKMNGEPIQHVDALGYRLATQTIGAEAKLDVLSRGNEREVGVTLVRAPDDGGDREISIRGKNPFAGTKVASLSPRLAQKLNMPGDLKGVTVTEVAEGSPAAEIGFQPRDIVREVNGREITSADMLNKMASSGSGRWRFTIQRGNRLLTQTLRF